MKCNSLHRSKLPRYPLKPPATDTVLCRPPVVPAAEAEAEHGAPAGEDADLPGRSGDEGHQRRAAGGHAGPPQRGHRQVRERGMVKRVG